MKIALPVIIAVLGFTSFSWAQSPPPATSGAATSDDKAIRPFHFSASKEALADMRRRIAATKWPEKETVADQSQGVQLATIQKLARYWGTDYDWRKCEAKLNALPQFVTKIDGLDIHFIHVRSKNANALPIIITHGWPGSILEQLKIIGPLTDPVAHGGKAEDSFDVVIPSMPGYGFSGKPTTTGWDPAHIARAGIVLMKRLGYTKFVAQGGDWGALITDLMGVEAPPELLGIHTNMPGAVPPDIDKAAFGGAPAPAGLSAEEKSAYDQLVFFYGQGLGYALEMKNRPQSIYGVADSPIALAAWMIDHDTDAYLKIARAFVDKQPSGNLTRDHILDNITLYWLTGTGASAARSYWEAYGADAPAASLKPLPPPTIPFGFTTFPGEIWRTPRSWVDASYPNVSYFHEVDKGGHFAAWEEPELFSTEIRAAFRSLR